MTGPERLPFGPLEAVAAAGTTTTTAIARRLCVDTARVYWWRRHGLTVETYQHVIPADDQATAQLVGDLYRSSQIS